MAPALLEPKRYGAYLLLDRIGAGGMAEVFRARQLGVEGFARTVAIKRIQPSFAEDEDFIEMFITEAKLAEKMGHANVAQVYDLGQADGTYYIAMEYVAGVNLRQMWRGARSRGRLLPVPLSCYIVQKICEGLDYAHRKKDDRGRPIGLVHRDVSPQNILVSFEGEIKVVDFGIAKAAQQMSKTEAGVLKGKFGYMSPEQVRGHELDRRSDVFALGILFWELLVGERLFAGGSEFETLERVRKCEVRPPSQVNKSLDSRLDPIVLKALSKDRGDRYGHTSELGEELQRFLFASEQVFGRQDLVRYMQRHFEKEIALEYERHEAIERLDESLFYAGKAEPPPALPVDALRAVTEETPAIGTLSSFENEVPTQPEDAPRQNLAMRPAARARLPEPEIPRLAPLPPPVVHKKDVLPRRAKVLLISLVVMLLASVGAIVQLSLRPAAAEPGSLRLETEPEDADIYLDGERVASGSPLTRPDLSPGPHVIEVRRMGYQPVVRSVRVVSGELTMERVRLQPK